MLQTKRPQRQLQLQFRQRMIHLQLLSQLL
jgi:hypothetical protein